MKEHSSQKRAKILTVLFVVMLLLPAPLWLLLAPHLDTCLLYTSDAADE